MDHTSSVPPGDIQEPVENRIPFHNAGDVVHVTREQALVFTGGPVTSIGTLTLNLPSGARQFYRVSAREMPATPLSDAQQAFLNHYFESNGLLPPAGKK